ncbi:MAG: TIR domain-containing protein [Terricaulis sp.]
MSGKVFINYRRGDDPGFTRALYLRLESEFSADRLFMDVEGAIRPGDDFVDVLNQQVKQSDIFLAVIGPRWLETLRARENDEDDFVHIEIKAALDQGKRVIPVLVGGASMPPPSALPESIRALARRNAIEIRVERFTADAHSLCEALRTLLANPSALQKPPETAPRRAEPHRLAPLSPETLGKDVLHAFRTPAAALRRALRKTMFAMSPDLERYALNGLYFDPLRASSGEPILSVVGADGHRLAKVDLLDDAGLLGAPAHIIHRNGVSQLWALLENIGGDIDIGISAAGLNVRAGARSLTCERIDVAFPEYRRVIPSSHAFMPRVRTREVAQALDELALQAAPADARVEFSFTPGKVRLTLMNHPAGVKSTHEIPAQFADQAPPQLVNARYAIDILQRIDVEDSELGFDDAPGPIKITGVGETDTLFVLMPIRAAA